MRIHALTVSVDYSAELARSIDRWVAGLASLTVVTCHRDLATRELAVRAGARVFVTDAFYEEGAFFNKGRALELARGTLPAEDWHLLIDADVIAPETWPSVLEAAAPQPGILHGARRVRESGEPIFDAELAGFFHLWHSSDSRAAAPLARDFIHAGNYDSDFLARWPRKLQRILPLELVHLGETGRSWCGRGNEAAMEEIRRRRRTRSWRQETVRRAG